MTRAGLVLCGGRSLRMGRDKAWLEFGGETLLARVVRRLREAVDEVVVVGREGQPLPALDDDVQVVRDDVADRGPLSGIANGLAATSAEAAFATACDAPFLSPDVVRRLFDALGAADAAVVEQDGFLHPLCAVYRRTILPAARRLLDAGRLRPVFLYDEVATVRVAADRLRAVDPDLLTLDNLNTENAYARALHLLEGGVTVELYEIARRLAGRATVRVGARTLGEALAVLAERCPALVGTVVEDGRLARHWRASVGGRTFVEDPATPLAPGDHLVIVSALAGG